MRFSRTVLILTLMALTACLRVWVSEQAHSQPAKATIVRLSSTVAHDDVEECSDSDGDGECDYKSDMD